MRKLIAELLNPATTYELELVIPKDLVRERGSGGCKRVSQKGFPTVETPRGASLGRGCQPRNPRGPAGARWQNRPLSPPRRRPTGRLYSGDAARALTFPNTLQEDPVSPAGAPTPPSGSTSPVPR